MAHPLSIVTPTSVEEQSSIFRTAYDGLQTVMSDFTGIDFSDSESRTHQSFQDECDINKIIERHDAQGFLNDSRGKIPQFYDATLVPDYQSALNQVIYAQTLFDDLPAELRQRFRNDPAEFVEFFNDPKNTDEAVSLGLATPRPLSPDASHEANLGSKAPDPEGRGSFFSMGKKTTTTTVVEEGGQGGQ